MRVTHKLIPLYKDGDETKLLETPKKTRQLESLETERMASILYNKSHGMGNCSWVNSMLRSSSVMLVAHSHNMGDFKVLGVTQVDIEWVSVRVLTKTGEASIILPWYSKFDLFLGSP